MTTPGASLAFSECWDGPPGYPMTFDGLDGTGLESACVFPTAAPPTIAIPCTVPAPGVLRARRQSPLRQAARSVRCSA